MTSTTKQCRKCKEIKHSTEFSRSKTNKDGLQSWCKRCKADLQKTLNKEYNVKNKDKIQKYTTENKEKRAEYMKGYNKHHWAENKEKLSAKSKEYRNQNEEKLLVKSRLYRESHKKQKAATDKQYRAQNLEHLAEYHKQYYQNNKDKLSEHARKKYLENRPAMSDKAKEKYRKTREYVLKRCKIYRDSHKEQIADYFREYNQTPRGKVKARKQSSKHRQLEYNPINDWFEGSEYHHLHGTDGVGIYIPSDLHRSIPHNPKTNQRMDEINAIALEWYERMKKVK